MIGQREPDQIESTFRNGSLTAISVLVGFSLSFLARWAGSPGAWEGSDIVAVLAIAVGIVLQIGAVSLLLTLKSLLLARYNRAVLIFLVGLGFVATGVAIAIVGDIVGVPQHVMRG